MIYDDYQDNVVERVGDYLVLQAIDLNGYYTSVALMRRSVHLRYPVSRGPRLPVLLPKYRERTIVHEALRHG